MVSMGSAEPRLLTLLAEVLPQAVDLLVQLLGLPELLPRQALEHGRHRPLGECPHALVDLRAVGLTGGLAEPMLPLLQRVDLVLSLGPHLLLDLPALLRQVPIQFLLGLLPGLLPGLRPLADPLVDLVDLGLLGVLQGLVGLPL